MKRMLSTYGLLWIFGFQEEKLGYNEIGNIVINGSIDLRKHGQILHHLLTNRADVRMLMYNYLEDRCIC